jgi:hypothetical protein
MWDLLRPPTNPKDRERKENVIAEMRQLAQSEIVITDDMVIRATRRILQAVRQDARLTALAYAVREVMEIVVRGEQ